MTSPLCPDAFKYAAIRCNVAGSRFSSLYEGMTMDKSSEPGCIGQVDPFPGVPPVSGRNNILHLAIFAPTFVGFASRVPSLVGVALRSPLPWVREASLCLSALFFAHAEVRATRVVKHQR